MNSEKAKTTCDLEYMETEHICDHKHHEHETDTHDCGHDHCHQEKECDCANGHHHEHHHENHHEHHHEHHHEEHEQDSCPLVHVTTHDVAIVGTVKCIIKETYDDALDELQSCMKNVASAVEDAGGLIGHIKAFAKEDAKSCMISVTDGDDIQRKNNIGRGVFVENACIVFGICPEELEKILRESFAKYL